MLFSSIHLICVLVLIRYRLAAAATIVAIPFFDGEGYSFLGLDNFLSRLRHSH